MTDTYTPGPWRTRADRIVVETAEGLPIAYMYAAPHRSRNSAVANARLITLTPELVAALQRARAVLLSCQAKGDKAAGREASDIATLLTRINGGAA